MVIPRLHSTLLVFALFLFSAGSIFADLVKIEVRERFPFPVGVSYGRSGAYEIINGRLLFELDPKDLANARIVDLALAPINGDGQVEFWSDFTLLKPVDPAKGNGTLLYDVHNRGNKLALWTFNDGLRSNTPTGPEHAGNGFLMREGYSVLWTGWSGEIQDDDTGRLLAGIPVAVNPDGSPVTGQNHVEISVDELAYSRDFFQSPWGISAAYPAVSLENTNASLTRKCGMGLCPMDKWQSGTRCDQSLREGGLPSRLDLRSGLHGARSACSRTGTRGSARHDLVPTVR